MGSNHAGIAAANKLLENSNNNVILFEQGDSLSFLGCMSSLCLSHTVASRDDLFYTSPESLRASGATLHLNTRITHIDFENKTLEALDQEGNHTHEAYDTLILATGSRPIELKNDGIHPIHTIKTFADTQSIDDTFDHHSMKNVYVIGAGLIGLETAVSASERHKHVTIIENQAHILSEYFDPYISEDILTLFEKAGIQVDLNSELNESYFEVSQDPYPHQVFICAIGVTPNTTLGKDHLKLGPKGAYLVNQHCQTSQKDVYAIGDCASVYSNALEQDIYSPRASHASHSGIVAANHINGISVPLPGTQGSIGSCLLGMNLFATGANTMTALKAGLEIEIIQHKGLVNHPFIDKDSYYKAVLVYEKSTRRLVGAQLSSLNDISMLNHMFSLAIAKQCTIDELFHLDMFYHPQFNKLNNNFTS